MTDARLMADVFRELADDVRNQERLIADKNAELTQLAAERNLFESQRKSEKERADRYSRERSQQQVIIAELEERQAKAKANLAQLDSITMNLWLYMVELAGHRDTAKTKAERIALGHVVERLGEIRGGIRDIERAALNDPAAEMAKLKGYS